MSVRKTILAAIGFLLIFLGAYFMTNLFIKPSRSYTLVFVGDSMTEYLGNFDEMQNYLGKYYPKDKFLLLNYGFGSTNILSVPDRLEKVSDHGRL